MQKLLTLNQKKPLIKKNIKKTCGVQEKRSFSRKWTVRAETRSPGEKPQERKKGRERSGCNKKKVP